MLFLSTRTGALLATPVQFRDILRAKGFSHTMAFITTSCATVARLNAESDPESLEDVLFRAATASAAGMAAASQASSSSAAVAAPSKKAKGGGGKMQLTHSFRRVCPSLAPLP
jgi:hypothetical protein